MVLGLANASFAGDDASTAVSSATIGLPYDHGILVGIGHKDSYVSDEAQTKNRGTTMYLDIVDKMKKDYCYKSQKTEN
ncbi:hypothetical protein KIL84_008987 [Mauremys mutica]|uniref:Uncharacterized protein n=1 Tax=Mauremys mutica TaxID=74926 RepID=A0A9D4B4G5_9SAUR|nr:hypothetical protein KIL84_008987 [Mauremys mutica]